MELRRLKYFIAIAESGSFHRASEVLNIAQPALSRRIQDLEHEVGFSLFERLPLGVRLSRQGQLFLPHARRVMAELEAATRQADLIAKGRVGTLNVGLLPFAPQLSVVSESLWAFKSRCPEVVLNIVPLQAQRQLQGLLDQTLDLGFLYYRPTDSSAFAYAEIQVDTFCIGMSCRHRLAGRSELLLRDLVEEPFVAVARTVSSAYFDQVMNACAARGFQPRVVQEVADEATQVALVAAGDAVCFVNSTILDRARPENLAVKKLLDLPLAIHLDLAWRRGDASPTLNGFLEVVLPMIERYRRSRLPSPSARPAAAAMLARAG